MLVLEELIQMDGGELHGLMDSGHPLDPEAMADTQYTGVDLSLPPLLSKLLWKTFRKTFHKDPDSGVLRGWNVKMQQNGVDGPALPLTDPKGRAKTFGHYHLRSAQGIAFPRAWRGSDYLDYTCAGNKFMDVARFGFTPLVAVNEGSSDLLLGWELFKLGPLFLPLPLYYALRIHGPLEELVEVPRAPKSPNQSRK